MICKYCGHKSHSGTKASCSCSPTGIHVYMEEKDRYICEYCGHKSTSGTRSSCSKSPTKHHVWSN
ncbi:MAG: hypothetical protein GX677_11495 [Treponema sp.]|nr:hypothetical protein [Treponema sp.]